MATTVVKPYSQAPYHDDFSESKNFHRILFKPGYSVQARELTQLQTALQAQIDRHGQYSFKDGSRVINGKTTLNVQYDYLKLESGFTYGGTTYDSDADLATASNIVGTVITGTENSTNQVKAQVLAAYSAASGDPITLFIRYIEAGGEQREIGKFVVGERITSVATGTPTFMIGGGPDTDGNGLASSITSAIGQGSIFNIEEGVYFIAGTFAYVPAGSLLLDKYDNTPNYIVGLKVTENTVNSNTDSSLVDNAQGTPNYSAPGADRYQIVTELIKEPLDLANRTENDYITLAVITDGKVDVDKTDKNLDTELTDRLARRTFEESGSYTVNPYQLNIREHLNDGTNNGYLTAANGGDADKLAIGVEPNVAYVKGYRVENVNTKYVEVDKPRDEASKRTVNAETQTLQLGNYIKLKTSANIAGIPDINTFSTINLHDTDNAGGSVIGTCRARGLALAGGELRLYIYDVNITSGSFADVQSVQWLSGSSRFKADLAEDGSGAITTIFDNANNGLVFKLPYTAVDTLYDPENSLTIDTSYTIAKKLSSLTASNTISISEGVFVNTDDIIAAIEDTSGANPTYSNFDTSPTVTLDTSTQITFTDVGGATAGANQNIVCIAEIRKSGIAQKQKTRRNSADSYSGTSKTGTLTNNELSLDKADIIQVNSITDANGVDITEKFTLDNGQRDNYYGIGKVILKPDASHTGNLTVLFDYYDHEGGDYFTVDSYPPEDYASIYRFNGNQGLVSLRDCIDFRPRLDDTGANYTGSGASTTGIPVNLTAFTADITHYMPRVDKLYVTRLGEFKIAKGVASMEPKAPEVPDDGLELYNFTVSPYVFSLNGIKSKIIDNKRYTMRDIGSIDKRVKNLEYYTSLSLLEQSAADIELYDSQGLSRFKNGFIVDSFNGHQVGDTGSPDYNVSIDKQNGILRPKFNEKNTNLIRKAGDTGAVEAKGIVTLPYTQSTFINQPYSSTYINVNPYNVFSWSGLIELSPDSDEWKEVDVRPKIVIDDTEAYDQFLKMAEEEGILGTVWNEWQTNWTGVEVDQWSEINEGDPRGRDTRAVQDEWEERDGQGETETTYTATTTTQYQSRSGTRTDVGYDTITRSNGVRVVEVNFIPFIRSRKVFFKAQMMKPNTRVYPFFDGTDISDFTNPESFQEFSGQSNVETFEGLTGSDVTSAILQTNGSGVIEGSFVIPRNDALKFAAGAREFRLTDSSTNDKNAETTFAEAQYFAQGMLEVHQEEVISTRVPKLVYTEVNEDRTVTETNVTTETTEYIDPVAETFLVNKDGGAFMKSVDLYFKSKDDSIPVRVSIRTTLNGFPTQKVVPGADVVVYPDDVSISDDASAATRVEFDYPIYLSQDTEYAIVLMSQCDNYNVFIAEMGGQDLTDRDKRITKQPYDGVLFTSANASTWTPEQSKDLKFKLRNCTFSGTSGTNIVLVNDELPARRLGSNPLYMTQNSGVITVSHKNHGMYETGTKVVISGATADINGIAYGSINGTHTITASDHNGYTFTISGQTATNTGYYGGSGLRATENRHMDTMYPHIQNMQVPGTSLSISARSHSAQSVDGNEGAHVISQNPYSILPNRNVFYSSPQLIASQIQETEQHVNGEKSLQLTCTLRSDKDHLSPVIDLNRASVFTVENIINAQSGSEEVVRGGPNVCKYITKKVELAEEADIATVYLGAQKPGFATIDLYYRALPSSSSSQIGDIAWVYQAPTTTIPSSTRGFSEVKYEIDPAGSFGQIQFKIVLKSTNSSQPPRLKDFRAICAT